MYNRREDADFLADIEDSADKFNRYDCLTNIQK